MDAVNVHLQDYWRAIARSLPASPPIARDTPGIKQVNTPAYSHATMALVSEDQLEIDVDLGPLMWHHVYRGSSAGHRVNTWA